MTTHKNKDMLLTELREDGLAAGAVDQDCEKDDAGREEEDLVAGGCSWWTG